MRDKYSGFTLVELLVTVIVGSIVIGAVFASYQLVTRSQNRLSELKELHESGQVALGMIRRDIQLAGYSHNDCLAQDLFSMGSAVQSPVISIPQNQSELTVKYDFVERECGIEDVGGQAITRRTVTYSVNDATRTLQRKISHESLTQIREDSPVDLLDNMDQLRFNDDGRLVTVYLSMSQGDVDDRDRPLVAGLADYFDNEIPSPVGRERIEYLSAIWAKNRSMLEAQ